LAGVAVWEKGGTDARVIVPDYVAGDIATLLDPDLPRVCTVVEAPFVTAGGRLVVRPGSDPESMYYYHAPSLALPPVPERPTPEDIDRAKGLVFDDLPVDSPFGNEASQANMMAFLLLGFMRPQVHGPAYATSRQEAVRRRRLIGLSDWLDHLPYLRTDSAS
jgi:hypothetical protein